jgi:hypothetical protein
MASSSIPEGPDTDARHGLSRRGLIGGTAAAATAVSLGSGLMQPAAAFTRTPARPRLRLAAAAALTAFLIA